MKRVHQHNGFIVDQLVICQKNLAIIVYIEIDESLSEKFDRDIHYVRLGLINEQGIQFANTTSMTDRLKPVTKITFE